MPRSIAAGGRLGLAAILHVLAGALIDSGERVLIAQRPSGKHLAGGWEFPGGKIESGESRIAGLARELGEEIGVTIEGPRPLIRVRHVYPEVEVLLDVWLVRRYRGEPRGLDGQALRWVTRDELAHAPLLPADRPIVTALRLPEELRAAETSCYRIITPGSAAPRAGKLTGVLCASAGDAAAAQDDTPADFIVLASACRDDELARACDRANVPVFARGIALERAWELGATGVNRLSG